MFDKDLSRMRWIQRSFTNPNSCQLGSGCSLVGRAVASDARGPRFVSSHRQTFILDIYLFSVNCIEKTKIKIKEAVNGPFFNSFLFVKARTQKVWLNLAFIDIVLRQDEKGVSLFKKKWAIPGLFFVYFQKTSIQFLQQINVVKGPSSIQHWDSNPRPSERESPPITRAPALKKGCKFAIIFRPKTCLVFREMGIRSIVEIVQIV